MKNHWNIRYTPSEDLLDFCKKNVTVVIPTLNEAATLETIILESQKYSNDVILIDGHSTDNTKEIANNLKVPIYFDNKKGKGDAIRCSVNHVQTDIIVYIDADMSHDPSEIPKIIEPIYKGEADHVVGSRPKGGSDELHGDLNKFLRMIGSDIITLGINYRFGIRITDSQNGFRAIKTSVIKQLNLKEDITTIEQEMTIKTLKKGFKLAEVPSHEYARLQGDSHIKLSKVSIRYVYSWLKYLFF